MLKKFLLVVLVFFLGYWLVERPESFATFAENLGSWLWTTAQSLFQSVIDVLDSLGS